MTPFSTQVTFAGRPPVGRSEEASSDISRRYECSTTESERSDRRCRSDFTTESPAQGRLRPIAPETARAICTVENGQAGTGGATILPSEGLGGTASRRRAASEACGSTEGIEVVYVRPFCFL